MTNQSETSRQSAREHFAAQLRARRSINLFRPGEPPKALLLDAIEVARWAPNHRLTEPWHFYLLGPQSRAAVTELAVALDTVARGERAGAARRERMRASHGIATRTRALAPETSAPSRRLLGS